MNQLKIYLQVKEIIDVENTENLVIQHNNTLAYTKVSDSAKNDGVIIGRIIRCVEESS